MDKDIHKLPPLQRAKAVQRGLVQIRKLQAIAKREIESLADIMREAPYTLVDKIMTRMLPKGSEIDQAWATEVIEKHIPTARKWDDPGKVIPVWIIKQLVITDEDQKKCLEAALEEIQGLPRMAPKDTARVILELRDIVKALGYGSQLTIPMVGAAVAKSLSNTVKARLSDWTHSQKQFGLYPRAKLDKLPSNYTRANLMKLVTKAQSFYRETAKSPANTNTTKTSRFRGARVTQAQEVVDEDDHNSEEHEESDDSRTVEDEEGATCAALRTQVGHTGPAKKAYQETQGKRRYRPGGLETPRKGALVQRSGTGSVMATDTVLRAQCSAIVTDAHFEGCWNCGGKHYQRDCPKLPGNSAPILKALKEVQHQKDIVGNARLAATVALQGVSAEAYAVLPEEAQEALVAYLDSGMPELYQEWANGISNQA